MSTSPASSPATASQTTPNVNATGASNHVTTSTSPAPSSRTNALAAELHSNVGNSDSDKPNDGNKVCTEPEWTQERADRFNDWVYTRPKGFWQGVRARQRQEQEIWLEKMRKELAEEKEARKAPERSESDLKNSNID